MSDERRMVTREDVIRFYVAYDRGKKNQPAITDFSSWEWSNPDSLDQNLKESGLKHGVLAAYRQWTLTKLGISDLLVCAIVNQIFPGEPQAISQLVLRGKLAEWLPKGSPNWWQTLGSGADLPREAALILRPALKSEAPARWYVEDGSGRALALVQRALRYGETSRTAWAYIGQAPDERAKFILDHPELKG